MSHDGTVLLAPKACNLFAAVTHAKEDNNNYLPSNTIFRRLLYSIATSNSNRKQLWSSRDLVLLYKERLLSDISGSKTQKQWNWRRWLFQHLTTAFTL